MADYLLHLASQNEVAGLMTMTGENEEQGTERSATNGAKEFDPRELGKDTRGKLISIALSGHRSNLTLQRIATAMQKTGVTCPSKKGCETFKEWYRRFPSNFHRFLYRLRGEGEKWEKAFSQRIPDKYHEKYN